MGPNQKAAAAIGAVALVGIIAAYALTQAKGTAGKYLLQTTSGPGGNINPSSASGIFKQPGQVVTITITANPGYTIGQVLQNGSPINSSTTDTVETYQITMNMNQEIDATFYPGGLPPIGAPTQIQALNQQTIVWGYYGCKLSVGSLNALTKVEVNTCDQNWVFGNYVWNQQIQFKVIDANGQGVPDIIVNGQHSLSVALYPSLFPDGSKYQGYLILNGQMVNQNNPLILYPNSQGIVTVNLAYFCDTASIDQPNKMPYDAGLNYTVLAVLVPLTYSPYNGSQDGLGIPLVAKGGHGVTGQGPAAMGNMQTNTVIAKVQGSSIQPASTLCSCGFNIKML